MVEYHNSAKRTFRMFRTHNWVTFLILLPLVIAVVLLGAFFYAIMLAVLSVFAGIFFVRVWWLKRKMRQAMAQQTLEGEYAVIRDRER